MEKNRNRIAFPIAAAFILWIIFQFLPGLGTGREGLSFLFEFFRTFSILLPVAVIHFSFVSFPVSIRPKAVRSLILLLYGVAVVTIFSSLYAYSFSSAVPGATHGGAIYLSRDGGENWSSVWEGSRYSALPHDLVPDLHDDKVFYAALGKYDREPAARESAVDGCGILSSIDGGSNWRLSAAGNGLPEGLPVNGIARDPSDGRVLLAAVGRPFQGFQDEEKPVRRPENGSGGIYRSADGGESWRRTDIEGQEPEGGFFTAVSIAGADSRIAYAASADFIYTSDDGGESWHRSGPERHPLSSLIDSLSIDPRDSSKIVAAAGPNGILLSDNGGRTFEPPRQGLSAAVVSDAAAGENDRLYVAGMSGLWAADNGGTAWERLGPFSPGGPSVVPFGAVAVDPSDPDHLLAGMFDSIAIYESSDAGMNWYQRLSPPDGNNQAFQGEPVSVGSIFFLPDDPSTVFAGTASSLRLLEHEGPFSGGGLYISHDGGTSWERSAGFPNGYAVYDIGGTSADGIYAAAGNGLYLSRDEGENWTTAGGIPGESAMRTVALSPWESHTVIAGSEDGRIFRSTDGGGTWDEKVYRGAGEKKIHRIRFSPVIRSLVCAADASDGVFVSVDDGKSWTSVQRISSVLREKTADGRFRTAFHCDYLRFERLFGLYRDLRYGNDPSRAFRS